MDPKRKEQEEQRLRQYSCPSADTRQPSPVGVLLSDEILHYVQTIKLIDPFDQNNLKPAGYELTVGDEYVLGGERKVLAQAGEIRIPPFNVVVIKTRETINLPRFLIARWNIRVKWAYHGLLWVGGPQVDPGWVGHLFCPIYNLSDKEVVLRPDDRIALMDFVTTTPFNTGKSLEYPRPPKRVLLDEYGAEALKSALYTEAKTRIDRVEQKAESLMGSTLVLFTILFAALAVLAYRPTEGLGSVWDVLSLISSVTAFFLAYLAYRRSPAGTGAIAAVGWVKGIGLTVASLLFLFGVYQAYQAVSRFSRDTKTQLVDRRSAQDTLARQVLRLKQTVDSMVAASRTAKQSPAPRNTVPD
jgi:deoxycytidine triphosphate deaminase